MRQCPNPEQIFHPDDLAEFRDIFLHYKEYDKLEGGVFHKLLKMMFRAKYRADELEFVDTIIQGIQHSYSNLPETIRYATFYALFNEELPGSGL